MSAVQELAEHEAPLASDHNFIEVPCQRSVASSNFRAGVQDFVFTIGRPSCWYPSSSYFRVDLEVLGCGTAGAIAQPKVSEQIALAENCVSNGYSNAYFLAGGQQVSAISNYLAQASMVQARTETAKGWGESAGQAYGLGASFSERCLAISSNGVAGANPSNITAPIGLSGLNDCREEMYKPIVAGAYPADHYTVALTAATGAVLGVDTAFAATDVGNTIVIAGTKYTVLAWTDALNITVSANVGAVVATANWYMIRRNLTRSTQASNKVSVLWRPPLGIFGLGSTVCLGSGDYRFQLSPSADFRTSMIETYNPNFATASGANCPFTINVLDVKFYAHIAKASIPDGVQECFFNEWQLQSKTQTNNSMVHSFTVPPSTRSLYVFLQAGSAGSNPAFPPSRFAGVGDSDLNLTAIQITYANQTKPQTRWVSSFVDGTALESNTNFLTQLYHQQLIESGIEEEKGGVETMNQWLQRGPLYGFRFDRDMHDRATEVQLQITYGDPSTGVRFEATSKIFLCAQYSRQVNIRSSNGAVVEVQSLAV